ncbi:glutathione-dependent formaldehyde-activating enzyme [mine drainage metagenome]|uniref:Glutathione-dependent formaldehyde-activating enzyme n=1 Tax=mine drainage metagenome TaxID=410659 RepID=A0A1J5QN45_9ZZZZ
MGGLGIVTNATGGCLCGDVRYRLRAEPIALYCCHCTECQTTSGSSFVMALRIPYGGLSVTKGSVRLCERAEAGGIARNVGRCPSCLTALWSERLEGRAFQTVYAGTLDDSANLQPVAHIWIQDAQPWIRFDERTLRFSQSPPTMQPIIDVWRQRQSPKQG